MSVVVEILGVSNGAKGRGQSLIAITCSLSWGWVRVFCPVLRRVWPLRPGRRADHPGPSAFFPASPCDRPLDSTGNARLPAQTPTQSLCNAHWLVRVGASLGSEPRRKWRLNGLMKKGPQTMARNSQGIFPEPQIQFVLSLSQHATQPFTSGDTISPFLSSSSRPLRRVSHHGTHSYPAGQSHTRPDGEAITWANLPYNRLPGAVSPSGRIFCSMVDRTLLCSSTFSCRRRARFFSAVQVDPCGCWNG